MTRYPFGALALAIWLTVSIWPAAPQQPKKPNIVVNFGDDIGQTSVSAYPTDLMGYHTPNIDRLAKEGMIFTDYDADIADNTIVLYTTDNGPHMNSWPDGAMTPFRSEKNTNWEGAFRIPCMIRWPGHIKPGSVSNEIVSGADWLPTFLAAAGDPNITDKLLQGYYADGKHFKVHLDGFNQLPYLTGQAEKSGYAWKTGK